MAIERTHVDGRDVGKIMLYALSTCVWCRKTKKLLQELGVAYDYVDVDLLTGADRKEVDDEVKKWNPRRNYPTVVVRDEDCVAGFNETKLREIFES